MACGRVEVRCKEQRLFPGTAFVFPSGERKIPRPEAGPAQQLQSKLYGRLTLYSAAFLQNRSALLRTPSGLPPPSPEAGIRIRPTLHEALTAGAAGRHPEMDIQRLRGAEGAIANMRLQC